MDLIWFLKSVNPVCHGLSFLVLFSVFEFFYSFYFSPCICYWCYCFSFLLSYVAFLAHSPMFTSCVIGLGLKFNFRCERLYFWLLCLCLFPVMFCYLLSYFLFSCIVFTSCVCWFSFHPFVLLPLIVCPHPAWAHLCLVNLPLLVCLCVPRFVLLRRSAPCVPSTSALFSDV